MVESSTNKFTTSLRLSPDINHLKAAMCPLSIRYSRKILIRIYQIS